ncbi:hypothetical protein P389DRAFT_177162 [Cystobasidium minutum MCA 4210]|uniref:uncharacterized protein n=1 Tax=Cystobasidium minutum MCA 4210 TaxID=1397322 RepID=UPI0034CFEB23|eukprot:jgi/Rhomi1/177162/fgenesh1_pg.1_\
MPSFPNLNKMNAMNRLLTSAAHRLSRPFEGGQMRAVINRFRGHKEPEPESDRVDWLLDPHKWNVLIGMNTTRRIQCLHLHGMNLAVIGLDWVALLDKWVADSPKPLVNAELRGKVSKCLQDLLDKTDLDRDIEVTERIQYHVMARYGARIALSKAKQLRTREAQLAWLQRGTACKAVAYAKAIVELVKEDNAGRVVASHGQFYASPAVRAAAGRRTALAGYEC